MSNNTKIKNHHILKRVKHLEGKKTLSNCVKTSGIAKNQRHIFMYADQMVANWGLK